MKKIKFIQVGQIFQVGHVKGLRVKTLLGSQAHAFYIIHANIMLLNHGVYCEVTFHSHFQDDAL